MAGSDYTWCSGCGCKAFYNNSDFECVKDVACLCVECANTFEIVIRRKKSKRLKERLDNWTNRSKK